MYLIDGRKSQTVQSGESRSALHARRWLRQGEPRSAFHAEELMKIHIAVLDFLLPDRWIDEHGKANMGIITIFHCRRAKMNKYSFYLHYFLNLFYHFTLRETAPSTHCIGGWVGPRFSLDIMEKRKVSCHYQESNPSSLVIQSVS
jgi:hypothetical protein